ncbi:MAG: hypothetical protein M5U01_08425 [Ardenticatenaceae bacterium]|nr:hypothetical protein [Ardenticatenaceae bacterium]
MGAQTSGGPGRAINPRDGREDLAAPQTTLRVLRGGAFLNLEGLVRCAVRYRHLPNFRYLDLGFRVALVPPYL